MDYVAAYQNSTLNCIEYSDFTFKKPTKEEYTKLKKGLIKDSKDYLSEIKDDLLGPIIATSLYLFVSITLLLGYFYRDKTIYFLISSILCTIPMCIIIFKSIIPGIKDKKEAERDIENIKNNTEEINICECEILQEIIRPYRQYIEVIFQSIEEKKISIFTLLIEDFKRESKYYLVQKRHYNNNRTEYEEDYAFIKM